MLNVKVDKKKYEHHVKRLNEKREEEQILYEQIRKERIDNEKKVTASGKDFFYDYDGVMQIGKRGEKFIKHPISHMKIQS